ncbi:MAG: prepilin-type N-terminal cleavage/methylation domain-containing protein [Candidatus Hydrogenedentota bacterium]
MNSSGHIGGRGGFTLVELVTVVAILAVVSTLGTMAFFNIDKHWRSVHTRSELHAAADTIFEHMRRDFAGTLSPQRTGVALRGIDAEYTQADEADRFWRIIFDDDRIVVPVAMYNSAEGYEERRRVMYRVVRREEEPPVLVRSAGPLNAEKPEDNQAVVPSGGTAAVLAMAVEYAKDGQWHNAWERADNPDAVRVSLTLMHPQRFFEQVARKAVFPIHVP